MDDSEPSRIYLYVLALEQGRYYVGTSANLATRIRKHFCGRAAEWTRCYRPTRVTWVEVLETRDRRLARRLESIETRRLMLRYGTANVRGGSITGGDEVVVDEFYVQGSMRSLIDDILGCGRPEDVPKWLWNSLRVDYSKDEFTKISEVEQLQQRLLPIDVSFEQCKYEDASLRKQWARWVLRGLTPEFANGKMDHKLAKPIALRHDKK